MEIQHTETYLPQKLIQFIKEKHEQEQQEKTTPHDEQKYQNDD
jgi:hypothetical protein